MLGLSALAALGCGGGTGPAGSSADAADGKADAVTQPDAGAGAEETGDAEDIAGADDADALEMQDATTDIGDAWNANGMDATNVEVTDAANADAPSVDGASTGPPPDLHCTTDVVNPLQPEAVLPLASVAGGAVPLCSGWVLAATTAPAELAYLNVLDGRVAGRIALPAAPGRFVVDFERDAAYVALPSRKSLARVDLKTAAITEVTVAAAVASVALANDGWVFVTEMPYSSESGIAVIDAPHGTLLYEDTKFNADAIAFDRVGNQLITDLLGLTRYKFDANAHTLTQVERPFGTCGVGGVFVSPDGNHVLSGCPPTTKVGASGGVYDLSPSSLTTVLGQFTNLGGSPIAFSPDSTKVAGASSSAMPPVLNISDVAEHKLLSTTSPGFGCVLPIINTIGWSRGAKLIHLSVTCSVGTDAYSELYLVQAR
jgi:hypothetical protein